MEDKSRTRKFRIINVIGNILLLLTVDGENRNIKSIWQERSELNNNRLRISWTNSKDYIPKLCIIARITLTYFLLPGVVGGHGDPQGADPLVDPLGPLVDLDTLAAEILEQVLRLPENTRQLADGLQMSRSILYQYFNTKIGVSGWSVLHPGNPKLMGCVVSRKQAFRRADHCWRICEYYTDLTQGGVGHALQLVLGVRGDPGVGHPDRSHQVDREGHPDCFGLPSLKIWRCLTWHQSHVCLSGSHKNMLCSLDR